MMKCCYIPLTHRLVYLPTFAFQHPPQTGSAFAAVNSQVETLEELRRKLLAAVALLLFC